MSRMQLSKAITGLSVAICVATSPFGARGQDYPTKPISFAVGFPPGGAVDTIARIAADGLSKELKQTVIVESKTGASGILAANYVAKSKPDGYTLLLAPGSHSLYGPTAKSLPFDPINDFEWISGLTHASLFVSVTTQSPFRTVNDIIAKAKANPETVKYGSVGPGSVHHLATELLARSVGVKLVHVPYRGEGPLVTALQQGEVDFSLLTGNQLLGAVSAGTARALANTAGTRSPRLPDVATVQEVLGLKDYDVAGWFGVIGPKGMPPEIVTRLNTAIHKAAQTEETSNRLRLTGGDIAVTTPNALRERVMREQAIWTKIIEELGLEKQ